MFDPRSPHRSRRACALVTLLACCVSVGAVLAARPAALRAQHGMVVGPEPLAVAAGREVLRKGGTAADAAVATAFMLAVTHPVAGTLGGGGFALHRAAGGTSDALDFRERAPRGLTPAHFLDAEGKPDLVRSRRGGLAVGIPGTVAGLHELHRRWGSRPWKELIEPALRAAGAGFVVYPYLAQQLEAEEAVLLAEPETRRIFTREGRLLVEGDLLRQPDLARTLRRIVRRETAGFYHGPVARAISRAARQRGGVLDTQDLAAYTAVLRSPLVGHYRGLRVVAFPPPSSGGVALLQMLRMLEQFDLRQAGLGTTRTIHLITEIERRAFADRSRWLGDPQFFDVPLGGLLDEDYLASRAASIDPARATPSAAVAPGSPRLNESDQTLHLSVADARGNVVAMTLTLNAAFGSGLVAPGTGVLLNNEIDDFALAEQTPNLWGLVGGTANAVAGGKRPLSSMTPTIVESAPAETRPLLVLGSPGGATIITSVLQVLLNVVDHRLPLQAAVDAGRFHHQWLPDELRHEPGAFSPEVLHALTELGHRLVEVEALGSVQAIGRDLDGAWLGAPDARRGGAAAGH